MAIDGLAGNGRVVTIGMVVKRHGLIGVEGQVSKDGWVEGQRGIEMALSGMRSLSQLLGNGDHGLRRSVPGVRIVVRRGGEFAEGQGVTDKGTEMGRKRCPIGVVIREALRVCLDSAIEVTSGGQEVCLCLRGGSICTLW